jgi:hypothetical protein
MISETRGMRCKRQQKRYMFNTEALRAQRSDFILFSVLSTENKKVQHKAKQWQSLSISGLSAEMDNYTSPLPLRLCGELLPF